MASPKREETKAFWPPESSDTAHQRTLDPSGDLILVANCPDTRHFKVSSKVLCLVSGVFENLILRNESQQQATALKIDIAFMTDTIDIVLRIIHLQMRSIPQGLPLMHLLDIARLVDRYEMHNSLGAFLELWIDISFYMSYAMADEKSALDWLYIMFVFDQHYHFTWIASELTRMSTGINLEDTSENFQSVLDKIKCTRDLYLQQWLNSIHNDYKTYVRSTKCQNRACMTQEFVVGCFTRLLEKYQIQPPSPVAVQGYHIEGCVHIFH
ncbi:hypothetical protein GX51_04525 [Blastomyces parvus]|uniref:BTB domain-containing protein n=1 Tax=Blastomyces parvus TaxID=2060905 RepID=A0A2B7X1N5_9EURO|nr:hypothetical protein GX51_04525 [Blastomyces parvus]